MIERIILVIVGIVLISAITISVVSNTLPFYQWYPIREFLYSLLYWSFISTVGFIGTILVVTGITNR